MSTADDARGATPEIPWIAAEKNPWGVPVLSVRPLTQTVLSTSADPVCARNSISFRGADGTRFAGVEPALDRAVPADIVFRRDRLVADGVLFVPAVMEHKWAVFHHGGTVTFVRSWQREVVATATLVQSGDTARITEVRGALCFGESEPPEWTVAAVAFVLRSHALDIVWPAPLPAWLNLTPHQAAMFCMSAFGKFAWVATPHALAADVPEKALRTDSLLHIAVARNDASGVAAQLDAGVPVDLLAKDGLAPMHWALVTPDASMVELLIERGSPTDVRSAEGATPLMNCCQKGDVARVELFLAHGADPNAGDLRGFTALHRAAELGLDQVAEALLDAGADRAVSVEGHTPASLAQGRGHDELAKRLAPR